MPLARPLADGLLVDEPGTRQNKPVAMRDHEPVATVSTVNPPTAWDAPVADRPVRATVAVPGSKSLTNRALILAAQATGPSRIVAPLRSRDTELMAAGLRALGVRITVITSTIAGRHGSATGR